MQGAQRFRKSCQIAALISSLRRFHHKHCNSYMADPVSADLLARSNPARFNAHKGLARSSPLLRSGTAVAHTSPVGLLTTTSGDKHVDTNSSVGCNGRLRNRLQYHARNGAGLQFCIRTEQ